MIPVAIQTHLQQHHGGYKHLVHAAAVTAQDLAAAEHVKGRRVAKAVVIRIDRRLALAVVSARHRVNLAALEEATACSVELVPEAEFSGLFQPCEPGAEPPLGLFGVPIFVDEELVMEPRLVMPAGTHQDAIELDTREWLRCERVQPIGGLGLVVH